MFPYVLLRVLLLAVAVDVTNVLVDVVGVVAVGGVAVVAVVVAVDGAVVAGVAVTVGAVVFGVGDADVVFAVTVVPYGEHSAAVYDVAACVLGDSS